MMPNFWEKIVLGLEKHSKSGVGGVKCQLWTGCKDQKGYGRKRVLWPSGAKTMTRTHRLAFMAHHKTNELPTKNTYGEPMEVSHLCHNKLCINIQHLVLESHTENMSRLHCCKEGVCTMAHAPPCVL